MINDENTPHPESSSASGVKETVRETKDKLKNKASEAAAQAKDRGEQYLRTGKERTANRIEGYSESMRHAAERFEREQDPNLAHYTGLLADKLERAAGYVRDHDLRSVQHDVEDLARRHPAIFFGGMFVAGLAAARFLKASSSRSGISGDMEDDYEYSQESGIGSEHMMSGSPASESNNPGPGSPGNPNPNTGGWAQGGAI